MAKTLAKKCHISAGAVVLNKKPEVLLLYRKATKSWHLPKGTQHPGETLKETAIREVAEEAGVKIRIEKYLGKLHSKKEDKTPKITYYFLAILERAQVNSPDQEHDRIEFMSLSEACKRLRANPLFEKEYELLEKYLGIKRE